MLFLEDRRYYVYALVDPRSLTVFYIGRGHGDRASRHFKLANKSNSKDHPRFAKIKKIISVGLEPYFVKLKSNLTFSESCLIEVYWISKIGLNILTNIDAGGSFGGDVFTSHPQKESYRRKISEASKKSNAKNREKHRENTLKLWQQEEYIKKQKIAALKMRSRWKGKEYKEHIISCLKQVDPELRKKAARASNSAQKERRKNSKWLTKGGKNKLVLKSEKTSYLESGWKLGLSRKSKLVKSNS